MASLHGGCASTNAEGGSRAHEHVILTALWTALHSVALSLYKAGWWTGRLGKVAEGYECVFCSRFCWGTGSRQECIFEQAPVEN